MHTYRMFLTALMAISLLGLVGCKSAPTRDPDYTPPEPPAPPVPAARPLNGSLYQAGYRTFLFEDRRAAQVGDLLTINLLENIDASKTSSIATERTQATSITNPTIFGRAFKFNNNPTDNLGSSLASSNATAGKGDTAQSNKLAGTITVLVTKVHANGNLSVKGEKLLGLNQGHQYIRIEGIVRPDDIAPNNTVASTRMANVLVDYGGEGPGADASKLGWLARFFVSAIFPF